MTIPIYNRVVLIIGPTTSGKTTLSNQLKETFPGLVTIISQDEVSNSLNEEDTFSMFLTMKYRKKFAASLKDAIQSPNKLIVLDTLNIRIFDVFQTICSIKRHGHFRKITLLKMNLPFELQSEFCGKRRDFDTSLLTTEELFLNMVRQLTWYQSSSGSLHQTFPFTDEYVILDPRKVEFMYSPVFFKTI